MDLCSNNGIQKRSNQIPNSRENPRSSVNQTRSQSLGIVCFETSYQKFDKIEILLEKKNLRLILIVTLVPLAVVIPPFIFSLPPNEKKNNSNTYHVLESEAIHVENDTSRFNRLMYNYTRCFHNVHGQKLNNFYRLIFLEMKANIDKAKRKRC